MTTGIATIWDGVGYRQVPTEEAEILEREDKCQNLSRKFFSATELKRRHEFSGYLTREMRAAVTAIDEPLHTIELDWKDFKKATAEFLGLPIYKVTKAQTLAFMEKNVEPGATHTLS